MRIKYALVCIPFALFLGSLAMAGSGSMTGNWRISRDFSLDGKLNGDLRTHQIECNSHHNKFTCRYIGNDASNDSIFTGETNVARTTKIISFYQYDGTYYATHSGKAAGPNRFTGTWYDVAGNSGDFEIRR